jgi:hypothetical protein
VTYEVEVPGLDPVFDGFTILHLSDLHGRVEIFGHAAFREWLAESDVVAVTGDLYHPGLARRRIARALDELRKTHRVVLVSGNHDYRQGRLRMEPLDVKGWLIDNRALPIRRGGRSLWLAGVPDLVCGRPDWARINHEVGEGPAILLSHRPDAALLSQAQRFQLILSGHTHGGQVVLPMIGALLKHNRIGGGYVAGRLNLAEGRVLVTSRGLGTSELPVRLLCRPELVRIRLRAPNAKGVTR